MKVLDSDMLVGVLRKNEDAIRKYEDVREEEISTTIFNAQELLFGALISEHVETNFRAAKALLDEIGILVYEERSMMETVKLQAQLEKKGRHVGIIDEMIAGICIANKSAIVTRNIKHFSKIPDIESEKW